MSMTVIATAAAAYMRQAITELRELDRGMSQSRSLAPGVLRFVTSLSRSEFFARVQQSAPVFLRHVMPVDLEIELAGTIDDVTAIAGQVGPIMALIRPGERVAVQARRMSGEQAYSRFAVKEAIDPHIEAAGGHPSVQGPDRILSIALTESVAYVGFSTPVENLSDWPGGEVRFRREEEQVSRAKFKLLEAFAVFQPAVREGGRALDLGAAPGGWTSMLLERGLKVTAVDTGELDAIVRRNPALTFLQQNASDVEFSPETFDLLTCDMSWNPLHTADLVVRLSRAVKRGAPVILTVKLMLQNPTRTIRLVREKLEEPYELIRVKQLYHNRDEVTMYLRKR